MTVRPVQELRVAGGSAPASVGSAAVRFRDEGKDIELVSVGAAATLTALRAVVHVNRFLSGRGERAVVSIEERQVQQNGDTAEGVVLRLHVSRITFEGAS